MLTESVKPCFVVSNPAIAIRVIHISRGKISLVSLFCPWEPSIVGNDHCVWRPTPSPMRVASTMRVASIYCAIAPRQPEPAAAVQPKQ
jgi:hypothetical protein